MLGSLVAKPSDRVPRTGHRGIVHQGPGTVKYR